MCRVFLFSYSCGWFSSFGCPSVFLLTICVTCCQLAFVQQRGLRQSRKKNKKKKSWGGYPAQLTSVMALQLSSSAKCLQSCFSRGHNLKRFSSCHKPNHCSAQPFSLVTVGQENDRKTAFLFILRIIYLFILSIWSWRPQTCDSKFHKSADRLPCLCHNSGKIQMCKTFNLPEFKRYLINLKCFSTILPSGAVACIWSVFPGLKPQ